MNDPQHMDDATLVRFLSGEAAPDEVARVQHWLSLSDDHRAELELMKIVWQARPKINADPDDSMWRWISARMGESPAGSARSSQPSGVRPSVLGRSWRFQKLRSYPAVAAAGIALLIIGGGTLMLRRAERDHAQPAQQALSTMREIVTKRGQRAVLDLRDGTHVVLAAGSRLRIPDQFGATLKGRDLYLEGQAFFQVAHDTTRPFRVITSAGIAQDIGTEFLVTALPETRGLRVVVAEGSVAIRGRNGPSDTSTPPSLHGNHPQVLTLRAGEMGFVDSLGLSMQMGRVNVAAYTSWTHGELVYDGAEFGDVVPDLMRWYDMDITLGDTALAHRRLTATFSDEAPDEMIKLLSTALDLRVERHGRSLTLYPRTQATPETSADTPPANSQPTGTDSQRPNAENAS